MNILIFGRGVIGTLYGWGLEQAGHTVTYYVRPGRAAEYGPTLTLDFLDARRKVQGVPVQETIDMHYIEEFGPDHPYDLIVVSVPHDRFPEVAAFLHHRVGQRATVLLFNNFWADPAEAAAQLPTDQLVWGFPAAGGGFDAHGVLRGGLLKGVRFGTLGNAHTQRDVAVRELFRESGFGVQEHGDFPGWLRFHFVANAGLVAQTLRAGSFARMTASPAHLRESVLNVRELLPLLKKRGVDFGRHRADLVLFQMPPVLAGWGLWLAFRLIAPLRAVTDSVVSEREVRGICLDMLAEAREQGVPTPRLEGLLPLLTRP